MASADATEPTTADVVVIVGGVGHLVARVRSPRCDITLVSDLLRLRLHARRLGWSIELRDADDRLRELLEFIGFGPDGTAAADERDRNDRAGDRGGSAG
jgi:hypothetical protein